MEIGDDPIARAGVPAVALVRRALPTPRVQARTPVGTHRVLLLDVVNLWFQPSQGHIETGSVRSQGRLELRERKKRSRFS